MISFHAELNRKNLASELSLGTTQSKASRTTENKFSQMLTRSKSPIENSTSASVTEKSAEPTSVDTITTKKTTDSTTRKMSDTRNKFVDLTIGGEDSDSRRYGFNNEDSRSNKSGDDSCYGDSSGFLDIRNNLDDLDHDHDRVPQVNNPQVNEGDKTETYLTKKEFDYAMQIVDKKITSVYRLCKYISEVQQEEKKSLGKLVALDELSDSFWNRAYKEITKQLIPTVLFPSTSEYREALEKYLKEHANHFIDSIGRNSWISMFEEKLLSEIKSKFRSKRNDLAASIRHAMFATFGEHRLDHVDGTTSSMKLLEWKTSEKTQAAYRDLFQDHELLTKIGYAVFKSYKEKELPTMHCAYVLAICDILLNPKSSGIKCNDKSVVRRVNAFLRAFESQNPVTPEMMEKIADEERRDEDVNRKKQRSSNFGDDEAATIDDDFDNYDDFVTSLDKSFN